MSSFWPIFKKELRSYFVSPIAYVVMVMFLAIAGYFFYSSFAFFNFLGFQAMSNPMMARNLNVTEGVLRPLYGNLGVILLFIMPLLTMRLFAEEKKQGTIELLLTYPVRDWAAVLAKFTACLAVYLLMLALTALYPVLLVIFARPEVGPILSGYLGLFLLGAAFIALGALASSLTENQIVAAAISFGALLLFWVLGWSSQFAGSGAGWLLSHLSLLEHFESFPKGIIATQDVVFYLSFMVFCLFLTLRSLESHRWRG
jgi:ABC-2 type transport system permease protein